MAATSFSSQGATPGYTPLPQQPFGGSSPYAKALGASGGTPFPAIPPAPTNQDVKSTTITNPDGSTHQTTYHPSSPQDTLTQGATGPFKAIGGAVMGGLNNLSGLISSAFPNAPGIQARTVSTSQPTPQSSGASYNMNPPAPQSPAPQSSQQSQYSQPTVPTQTTTPTLPPPQTSGNNLGGTTNPNYTNFQNPQGQGTGAGTPVGPTTYPGMVQAQSNAAVTGSSQSSQATQGLLGMNNPNSPLVTQQQQTAQDIQNLRNSLASETGDLANQGGELSYQTGRIGLLNTQEAAKEAAANDKLNALANIQATQNTGLSSAGGIANTAQSNLQSGLNDAASNAKPQLGSIGQVPYSPTTLQQGSPLGAPGGTAADAAKVAGQFQGAQAAAAAPGQAQAAITSTQQQQVAGYKSSLQQGQNLQSQLTDLITSFGLNPNDVNVVNSGLQKIALNTSDPHYQLLNNYVNDIANTYAQILTPAGGSQTDTTRGIASSMLDATAKGQSLIATMQGLDQQAQAKIAGVSTAPTSGSGTGDSISWDDIGK